VIAYPSYERGAGQAHGYRWGALIRSPLQIGTDLLGGWVCVPHATSTPLAGGGYATCALAYVTARPGPRARLGIKQAEILATDLDGGSSAVLPLRVSVRR